MRIRELRLVRYGRHQDLTLSELDGDVPIVVLGSNEAGKSTLFRCIGTLLFGFDPATFDRHPDVPWDASGAELFARIVASDGTEYSVERTLKRRPAGKLRCGDRVQDLGNRSLPLLHGLQRRVFESCYALTAASLAPLDPEQFTRIQGRLLGGDLVRGLCSSRDVKTRLTAEQNELYRPDRRGKPLARKLSLELEALGKERHGAVEAELRATERREELAMLQERMRSLRRKASRVDRVISLAPVARRLLEMDSIRGRLDKLGVVPVDLPADPASELGRLEESIGRRESESAALKTRRRGLQVLKSRAAADVALHEHREALAEALRDLARVPDRQQAAAAGLDRAQALRREAADQARELFSFDGNEIPAEVEAVLMARTFSIKELRQGLKNLELWDQETERLESSGGRSLALHWMLAPLSFLVAVCLLYAWNTGEWVLGLLGVLGLVFGALLVVVEQRSRQGALNDRRGQLERRHGPARRMLDELLAPLGLRPALVERPDRSLAEDLLRVRQTLAEAESEERAAQEDQAWIDGFRRRSVQLCARLECPAEPAFDALQAILERRRDAAQSLATRARDAESEQLAVEDRIAVVAQEMSQARLRAGEIRARLRAAVPGCDAKTALVRVVEGKQLSDELAHIKRELGTRYADLEAIRKQIARVEKSAEQLPWSVKNEERARRRQAVLRDEVQRTARRSGQIEAELGVPHRSSVELDAEIDRLRRERTRVLRQHDRLALLRVALDAAEASFRSHHQSQVVRRASRWISEFTEGRYESIVWDPDNSILRIDGPDVEGVGLPLELPVSRGTLDQAGLALRLALAEHLDQERGEPVPLILDEALVHCDSVRRTEMFRLFADLARNQQLFLFTCHESIARQASQSAGARVIELARSRARSASE